MIVIIIVTITLLTARPRSRAKTSGARGGTEGPWTPSGCAPCAGKRTRPAEN